MDGYNIRTGSYTLVASDGATIRFESPRYGWLACASYAGVLGKRGSFAVLDRAGELVGSFAGWTCKATGVLAE